MKNNEQKLNLCQKLLEIQKEVLGLGRDTKGFNYTYTSGSKVIEHFKPLMNKYGLLLKQEVVNMENIRVDFLDYKKPISINPSCENQGQNFESKFEILCKVEMLFTWIDVESGERETVRFFANGQNGTEKGLGSALTYGERYFFLKFFHINTDADDIDNPERKQEIEDSEIMSIVGSKDTMTRGQYNKISSIGMGDIDMANGLFNEFKDSPHGLKKYFHTWCISKGMKFNDGTKLYELIIPNSPK